MHVTYPGPRRELFTCVNLQDAHSLFLLASSPSDAKSDSTGVCQLPSCSANHLEERLLDQAQVRASYTPPSWGSFDYPNVWFLTYNAL